MCVGFFSPCPHSFLSVPLVCAVNRGESLSLAEAQREEPYENAGVLDSVSRLVFLSCSELKFHVSYFPD